MIYLDNAATTSRKPDSVLRAIDTAVKSYSANPGRSGHDISAAVSGKLYAARKAAAELFHFDRPENVVFTLNCTHALNYVIKGVLNPGDHVIISSVEHNAVMRPVYRLSNDGTITYDEAQAVFYDHEATARNFSNLIRKNTRMIICTSASNVSGQVLPIREIGQLCRRKGLLFTVDAAQSAGIIDIDMNDCCIDYLCCAGHKGLYGPMGTGILIASQAIQKTLIEGGTGNLSVSPEQPDELPERLESGTVNVPGIIGLERGISFVSGRGISRIYSHEMKLIEQAYKGLSREKRVKLYTPYPHRDEFVPVLVFNLGNMECAKAGRLLNKKGIAVRTGLHCAPAAHRSIGSFDFSGAVRISTSVFNSSSEIDTFLREVRSISKEA